MKLANFLVVLMLFSCSSGYKSSHSSRDIAQRFNTPQLSSGASIVNYTMLNAGERAVTQLFGAIPAGVSEKTFLSAPENQKLRDAYNAYAKEVSAPPFGSTNYTEGGLAKRLLLPTVNTPANSLKIDAVTTSHQDAFTSAANLPFAASISLAEVDAPADRYYSTLTTSVVGEGGNDWTVNSSLNVKASFRQIASAAAFPGDGNATNKSIGKLLLESPPSGFNYTATTPGELGLELFVGNNSSGQPCPKLYSGDALGNYLEIAKTALLEAGLAMNYLPLQAYYKAILGKSSTEPLLADEALTIALLDKHPQKVYGIPLQVLRGPGGKGICPIAFAQIDNAFGNGGFCPPESLAKTVGPVLNRLKAKGFCSN